MVERQVTLEELCNINLLKSRIFIAALPTTVRGFETRYSLKAARLIAAGVTTRNLSASSRKYVGKAGPASAVKHVSEHAQTML